MRQSLRRQFFFLRTWATVSSVALVVIATSAFRQAAPAKNLGEITVERINVVDANGTLRVVVAGKDRMHPGVMDGVTIDRPRPVAGILFFNDQGDEVGGLTYAGREENGMRRADASLMFDQLKQDQTIGFNYTEGNGHRTAGFQVWDRPDSHLSEVFTKFNDANKMTDATARNTAMAAIEQSVPPGLRRVFVGKNAERASTVVLSDANGKPRLTLTVDAAGNPRIEFLDEAGKVVSRLPAPPAGG